MSLALVFGLSFLNRGYGEGVVEGLAVKVIAEQAEQGESIKLYRPLVEVDIVTLMRGKQALHPENTLGPFSAFPIHSKEATKKHILFIQEEDNQRYPFSEWEPSKYRFEIYAKTSKSKGPIKVSEISRDIGQDVIDSYFTGGSTYLLDSWTQDEF